MNDLVKLTTNPDSVPHLQFSPHLLQESDRESGIQSG